MKPTFLNQLLALPQKEVPKIMEKVNLLVENPVPDGKNKKRIVSYKKQQVFRIRAGDHRILYGFGADWVAVYAVDRREDIYEYGDLIDVGGPAVDLAQLPSAEEALTLAPTAADFVFAAKPAPPPETTPLEREITTDVLASLRIEPRYHSALLACTTWEALVEAAVPDGVRNAVFDVVTTPNYEEVAQQPSLVVPDVDDLIRVHRGELIDFLLKLDPDQERQVSRAIDGTGPVLVKGGPGTGKSTIAIYRVREVLQALKRAGVAQPRILFTTYTNALISSTRQLLEHLLGDEAALVTVETADRLARGYVKSCTGMLDDGHLRDHLMKAFAEAESTWEPAALEQLQRLRERLSLDYFVDEFEEVIEAKAIASADAYYALPRVGRQVPLQRAQREAIWRLYKAYCRRRPSNGKMSWACLRRRAADLVAMGRITEKFDAVFVDEVQDLQPNALRMLVGICRSPDRLMLTADANQSIYGSGFSWTEVHGDLRFQGRTGILRKNYRSTREINDAAEAYLRDAGLEPEKATLTHVASGPVPAVRAVTPEAQVPLLVRYVRQATRDLRLGYGSCAVLVPTEDAGNAIAHGLTKAGLAARFMKGTTLDLRCQDVKVITHRSAKGLEFPIVAVAGFNHLKVPDMATEEERLERMATERRALYVAMTRAMRTLLVLAPDPDPAELFAGLQEPLWNCGESAA